MERESLILVKESALGISIVGLIAVLILFAIVFVVQEENPNKAAAKKLGRKEKHLREKEEKLGQIEKQFRSYSQQGLILRG